MEVKLATNSLPLEDLLQIHLPIFHSPFLLHILDWPNVISAEKGLR